jgi:hypothetical protein
MNDEQRAMAVNGALNGQGIQFALPQTVQKVTKTQYQTQGTKYDPEKLQALKTALETPRPVMSRDEIWANALANYPEAKSYTGGFGEEIISPWGEGLSNFARSFGSAYAAQKADEREKAAQAREDAIKAAQLEFDASKQNVTNQVADDYVKLNQSNDAGNTAYRFAPERIQELKDLNYAAGRWGTDWGKGISDMINTEQSKAYNEFEGKAKQYVQDQLKKIYGAQMTEAEGERFFKSMGLSPKLDPDLRWNLVQNALDDLARKNGMTIQLQPTQQTNMLPQKGQVIDGYEFLGGDPADAKNWRAK